MIIRGEKDIDAALERGSLTLEDAVEVQTFMDFLKDAPRAPLPYEMEPGFIGPWLHENVDFRSKWGDYMRGEQ